MDDWAATSARLLTISGAPGSGKTTFLQHLGLGERAARTYFCDSRIDATLDPVRYVEALASGLVASLPGYRDALLLPGPASTTSAPVYINANVSVHSAGTGATVAGVTIKFMDSSPRRAVDQLLRKPLEALGVVSTKPIFLVDALDETVSYGAEYGIARLIAQSMADLPIRFVVTTRPDERVVSLLRCADSSFLDLATDRVSGEDDIEGYIRARTIKLGAGGAEPLASRIAAAADGNYLYAHYALRSLEADDALPEQLPAGLDEWYASFVARELYPGGSASTDHRWVTRIRPVLALLVAARGRGLTRQQIGEISGIDLPGSEDSPFGVDDTLRLLGQFCVMDPETSEYRLYHDSFRDYLTQGDYPLVNVRDGHFRIGRYFMDQWNGLRWLECADPYPLRHLESHLLHAVQGAAPQASHEIIGRLLGLRTDLHYLEARTIAVGISAVLTDLARTPDDWHPPGLSDGLTSLAKQATQIRAILAGRAHRLSAGSEQAAAYFAQEVHNEAVRRRLPEVVARAVARLDEISAPHGRLLWSGGGESTANLVGVLSGHPGVIRAMRLTPDGSELISGSPDNTVRIWDLADRTCRVIQAPRPLREICISPDGTWSVTSFLNRNVYIWDHASEDVAIVSDIVGVIDAVTVTPDSGFAAAFFDETGRALSDGREAPSLLLVCERRTLRTQQWRFPSHKVLHLAAFPDSRQVLALTSSGPLVSVDIHSGEVGYIARPFDNPIWSWDFDSSGKTAVVGTATGEIWVLDIASGTWHFVGSHATDEHPDRGVWFSVTGVRFLDSAQSIVSVSRDGTARIWSQHDGSDRTVLTVDDAILSFVLTRDGNRLMVGTQRGKVAVCDLATGHTRALQGHRNWVTCMALDVAERTLFTGSYDCDIRMWNIEAFADESPGHTTEIDLVALSPGGEFAVSVDADGEMRSWRLTDGRSRVVAQLASRAHACVLVGGGTVAAALTLDGKLHLIGLESGEVRVLDKSIGAIISDGNVQPGSDGPAVGSWEPTRVRVAPMGEVESLQDMGFAVPSNGMNLTELSCIAAGRSGTVLVAGTANGTLWVWDLDSGHLDNVAGHTEKVNQVLVTGDSILSAATDGTVQLLHLSSRQRRTVSGTDPGCRAVGLGMSGDGQWAAAAWSDGRLALWDTNGDTVETQETVKPLLSIIVDPDNLDVACLGFSYAVIVNPFNRRAFVVDQLGENESVATFTSFGGEVFSPYAVGFTAGNGRIVTLLNRISIWGFGEQTTGCDLALPLHRRLVMATGKEDLLLVGDGNGTVALYRVH
ncbi:WD40 repeat domain-containing protein [Amorphoplanes nipponensis]